MKKRTKGSPKRRSGTTQAAQHRSCAGAHTSPKGMRGYERHPKHKGKEERR